MTQPQRPELSKIDLAQTTNIVYVAACVHSTCFTPFLRRGMGVRALAWFGPLALGWMLIYAQFTYCAPLMLYLVFWLFACFVQTAILRNPREHSRFPGRSIFRFLEIPLLLGVGIFLETIDPVLGHFVIGGAVAIVMRHSIEKARANAVMLDQHDGQVDAEWRAGQFR